MAQRELVSGSARARSRHVTLGSLCILIVGIAAVLAAVSAPYVRASASLPQFITEYDVPTPNSAPLAVTVGRDGNVWFTESNASKLARFDPSTGGFSEYKVPGTGDMWGITMDVQGNVWFTQYSLKGSVNPGGAIEPNGTGRLIRFDPDTQNFTVINVPTPGAFPFRLTTDAEGRVWFTELLGDQIGYYDPSSGKLQEYPVPTPFAGPADLEFDSHGILWFTETYNGSVAKFDPASNTFAEYRFASIAPIHFIGSPVGIAVTPNGIVWVGDHGGNWVVEFNSTSQNVMLYPTHFPPPEVYPISLVNDVVTDHQGGVWFTEHGGNSIGHLYPGARKMVEYAVPTGPLSTVLWLALAPNGDVWFTEWSSNKIGVVHVNLPVPLALSTPNDNLTIPAGGQTNMALEVASSQALEWLGEYVYSWPSYNPGDVNVTFSPAQASLSGETSVQSGAVVTVSPHTLPGEYVLGVGFDAGSIRVWGMVQTQVTAQTPTNALIASDPLVLAGVAGTIAFAVLIIMWRRGVRRNRAAGK